MRYFELHRDDDVSGVSGEGVVADGVVFDLPTDMTFPDGLRLFLPSGWVRLRWRGPRRSVVLWDSLGAAQDVHGHGGATRVVFVDRPAADAITGDNVGFMDVIRP